MEKFNNASKAAIILIQIEPTPKDGLVNGTFVQSDVEKVMFVL